MQTIVCVCVSVCLPLLCLTACSCSGSIGVSLCLSLSPFSSFSILHATPPLSLRMRGALFENKAEKRRRAERRERTGVAGS